jgi:quercetin dioxygenase-like cupin family protein
MNPHGATSMHFHIIKHETLLVAEGTLTIEILHEKTHQKYELVKGESFVMPPGLPHKLINSSATQGLIIVESSTFDSPEDSMRVF